MKGIVIGLLLVLTVLPAQASKHPSEVKFIDVAAVPTYAPEVAPVGHRFYTRHQRHHTERHVSAHRRSPDSEPAQVPLTIHDPSKSIPPSSDAVLASALGSLLEIPGGWADGLSTAIPQAAHDLAYLIARASDESPSIARQTPVVAIGRLVPIFLQRLASTFREAVAAGLSPCVQSAYRPPGFGIGGFRDKFRSAHSYGLAVDICGIDGPGSPAAIAFRKIAARHGVYGVYSVYSRAEFNHFQPTRQLLVADAAPLRGTITADGPRSLEKMWKVAETIIAPEGGTVSIGPVRVAHRHQVHYAHHRYRHYAGV